MAKQRRARARLVPRRARKAPARHRAEPSALPAAQPQPGARALAPAAPAPSKPLRTTYIEAVALYERGIQALQRHEFTHAAELLRSILTGYPDEKELQERARLYLNICERQIKPRQVVAPKTVEERVYAATLALNSGDYEQAFRHIGSVIEDDPANDHAHYVRAIALALRGDLVESLSSLVRAIELNPENRALARQDPDLEALRRDEPLRQAVDAAISSPRQDRRRGTPRTRISR